MTPTPPTQQLEQALDALYAKWLRCWMKDEQDPLFLRDALKAAVQLGRAAGLEEAAALLDAEVDAHASDTKHVPGDTFCEDYGCWSLRNFAIDIRALCKPSAAAGEGKL